MYAYVFKCIQMYVRIFILYIIPCRASHVHFVLDDNLKDNNHVNEIASNLQSSLYRDCSDDEKKNVFLSTCNYNLFLYTELVSIYPIFVSHSQLSESHGNFRHRRA